MQGLGSTLIGGLGLQWGKTASSSPRVTASRQGWWLKELSLVFRV